MPDSMDWVKSDMRSCDECCRETDAGEWPDWPNGICEECDPDLLLVHYDCDWCGSLYEQNEVKHLNAPEISIYTQRLCQCCFDSYQKENVNA